MQKQTSSKTYIFQGGAIGVSGRITHPFQDIVPVQASSALPASGGFGSARVDGFRYKEVLSFGSAYTEVIGTEAHEGIVETMTLSVVEKFNLLDVVTCDRIVARLTGIHSLGSGQASDVSIVPTGSRFERLRIGNQFFERLEIAPEIFCHPANTSWSGLQKSLGNTDVYERLASVALPGPDGKPVQLPRGGQASGVLGFSIALGEPESGYPLGRPLCFEVPQFGTVHLGEFFCYPTSRRLVMLRADMGCPVQGLVAVCGVDGGGESYP